MRAGDASGLSSQTAGTSIAVLLFRMGFSSLKRSSGITHVWMSSMGIKKPLEGNGDVWGLNKGGLGKVVGIKNS